MNIYVVGNALMPEDNTPLRLIPSLRKAFPDFVITEADPNGNFIPEEGSIIIDTVEGISQVQWFNDIAAFVTTKSVSAHDYDLGFHLQMLLKLKKISSIKILGIPQGVSFARTQSDVLAALVQYRKY